jgi:hypothetical protein
VVVTKSKKVREALTVALFGFWNTQLSPIGIPPITKTI